MKVKNVGHHLLMKHLRQMDGTYLYHAHYTKFVYRVIFEEQRWGIVINIYLQNVAIRVLVYIVLIPN